MIKSGFLSVSQRRQLEAIVRSPREDHGVARRANAILLLDDGKSCAQIGEFLYLDDDTIRNWYKQYQKGGLDLLTMFDWKGGHSRMRMAQEEQLCAWLEGRFLRWSRKFGPVVKVDRIAREMIQYEEAKEPLSGFQGACCA